MKKLYITFSGQAYNSATAQIVASAPRFGADRVLVYDDRWLMTTEFYQLNQWLWNYPTPGQMKGFGWFVWKPFIILDALDRFCDDGDVVLYTDGDTFPIADLSALYQIADRDGAMFFKAQGCSNREWVKLDCILAMAAAVIVEGRRHIALDSDHAVARFVLIKKGPYAPRQLLMEWLAYCVNPIATSFEPSTMGPEFRGFTEHRTEQAILSLLVHKYGYKLFREACQFGDPRVHKEDADLYPQLFQQVYCGGPRQVGEGSRFASFR